MHDLPLRDDVSSPKTRTGKAMYNAILYHNNLFKTR